MAPPTQMPPKGFGKRVRKRREALRLTQDDLAKVVGVSDTTVRNWEAERTGIGDDNMHALVAALDCEPNDLWQGWEPQLKRIGSSSRTLSDMQDQIDALRQQVDSIRLVIDARPDLAKLRAELDAREPGEPTDEDQAGGRGRARR